MQQHMMQGGPFHSIQSAGSTAAAAATTAAAAVISRWPGAGNHTDIPARQSIITIHTQTPHKASHSAPNVNNTFVNNNVNINQLNIQSVNHQGGGAGNNYNPNSSCASMQVQQTNMEQSMNVPSGGMASMTQAGSMSQTSMTQSSMNASNPGMMMNGNKMIQTGSLNMKDVNYGGMGPPSGMHKQMSPFAQSQNPQQVPTSGRPCLPVTLLAQWAC
ncbi:hypothetical protein DPMN_008085 [Dreissena polymorpha]|uniref:Uncharacterized protein n=1 Tax=Dreissena polymorpha TaxID=45954 RepID=A0A9D4MZP4_DREPO|nr:hypothetical protein DPMN_008085 [Dreissena polymorpha]